MDTRASEMRKAPLFGMQPRALRQSLADGRTVHIMMPTEGGNAALVLDGPAGGKSEPPGPPILPRMGGTPYRLVVVPPRGSLGGTGGTGHRVFELAPGESLPAWSDIRSILRVTSKEVIAHLRRLLAMLAGLLAPLVPRAPRRPPSLSVTSIGAPDPSGWLDALSAADLIRALSTACRC